MSLICYSSLSLLQLQLGTAGYLVSTFLDSLFGMERKMVEELKGTTILRLGVDSVE